MQEYFDRNAGCLHYAKAACAVTKFGHDRMACAKQDNAAAGYEDKRLCLNSDGCTFCEPGFPCERRIGIKAW